MTTLRTTPSESELTSRSLQHPARFVSVTVPVSMRSVEAFDEIANHAAVMVAYLPVEEQNPTAANHGPTRAQCVPGPADSFFGSPAERDSVADVDALARGMEVAVACALARGKHSKSVRGRRGWSLAANL
jgi:hypothetical protein